MQDANKTLDFASCFISISAAHLYLVLFMIKGPPGSLYAWKTHHLLACMLAAISYNTGRYYPDQWIHNYNPI